MDITIHLEKKQLLELLGNLAMNIAGSALLAFGVCAFVAPFDLIVGGATGIALITHKLLGVNVSTVAFLINMLVLIPGYFLGGRKLVVGSLISSFVYPIALAIFERIPSITTIADDVILATVCGGVVCGAGIGLVMRSGGSTGGLDIPVLLIHKFFHLPVDAVMNATDTCIMIFQIPFSVIPCVLYGIIYTYIMTHSLGAVLTFGSERLKLTVISEKAEDICHQLSSNDFGVTVTFGEGGYTGTPIRKLESVMPSARYRAFLKLVEEIDATAFITVEKVKDVKGRGYTLEREYIDMD